MPTYTNEEQWTRRSDRDWGAAAGAGGAGGSGAEEEALAALAWSEERRWHGDRGFYSEALFLGIRAVTAPRRIAVDM
ncbi:hypothetical protein AXG93_3444s1040 [Marchantia polymorpha subsp. ruderalis]|uniref:Uncharacterized protein n=1 Tax=Marchantia polymorpha subsp. ruderalis TaxID=1480154 RepID=A0A176VXN2_MARPO|nr:hypothetical protein AXG93_3444s1040 [Marchantia polymorpha subsp. ruderalis]